MDLGQKELRLDVFDFEASLPLFQRFIEFVPDGVLGVRETGVIAFANAQAEKMFGYTHEALVGRSMEMLVPERFRGAHPRLRADYHAVPRIRPMGTGLELHGLRADGSEFAAEISLSAIQSGRGTVVLTVIRDVSEHFGAERAARRLKTAAAQDLPRRSQRDRRSAVAPVTQSLEDALDEILADTDLLASQLSDRPELQAVIERLRVAVLRAADLSTPPPDRQPQDRT